MVLNNPPLLHPAPGKGCGGFYSLRQVRITGGGLLEAAPLAPSVSPPPVPPAWGGFQGAGVLHEYFRHDKNFSKKNFHPPGIEGLAKFSRKNFHGVESVFTVE
jgi:hypothetical protein